MAGLGARLVLICIIFCFLVSVCEARGGRRGGRGGRWGGRYRSRVGGGGSSSGGGGGGDAGMIASIIFGVIGGTLFLVVMYFVCKACVCNGTSDGVAKYTGSNGTVLVRQPAATTATTVTATNTTTNTTNNTHDDSNKTSQNYNGVLPPSYESAVNENEGFPPSPAYPNGDAAYPPSSSYPADPPGLPYPSNPSELPYPAAPGIGFRADGCQRICLQLQSRPDRGISLQLCLRDEKD